MNKVSLSFNLVLIFSLLVSSMVESRTLGDVSEMTGAATTEARSSVDAESIQVNHDKLSDAVPSDLVVDEPREAEASMMEETKPVTFTDTIPIIMNVDDTKTPCIIDNKHLLTDNANKIILGRVEISITTSGGKVTKITESSEGTSVESTGSADTESKDTVDELVPRGIGANVFFGKAISGSSEMYNMTNNDFYNEIFQTMNSDVFVVGRFAKLADSPHNRMVLAKFKKEETNIGDDSTANVTEETTISTEEA